MKGNPQIENGYTKIANELLEALASAKLNGSEYKIVLAIIRKTYGYNSKAKDISLTDFVEATGMDHKAVTRTINELKKRHIIIRNQSKTGINKHYKEWLGSGKLDSGKLATGKNAPESSGKFAPVGSGKSAPTAYPYNNKKNIKERKKEKPSAELKKSGLEYDESELWEMNPLNDPRVRIVKTGEDNKILPF